MFLRRSTRSKDGKQHTYYALVESVRTDAGPRQRVGAYLAELNHDPERRWQRTVVFDNRQGEGQQLRLFPDDDTVPLPDDPDLVRVRLSSVRWTNGRRFGDVWLARWLWHRRRLDALVARHLPRGRQAVAAADVVAIAVINRLCAPCREFALAEHGYAASALPDLLGVPDEAVTKDRRYRTLDALRRVKEAIEDDRKAPLGTRFGLDYELLLYDLTSTSFEGLAAGNDLAKRGYSRDHRGDCKQVVRALVVTHDGFPLAHVTLAGNTRDADTVKRSVRAVERRLGRSRRVWVMDRGMVDQATVRFLGRGGRRYLLAARRGALARFQAELSRGGWQRLPDNPDVEVKLLRRGRGHYLLARSKPRRRKERAIRRRQRRGLAQALRKRHARIAAGRLKRRDKVLERVGRLKARYPKGCPFVTISVAARRRPQVSWSWQFDKFKAALTADGAYRRRSNRGGCSAQECWATYTQLAAVEHAFRVLKSDLLLRPLWHQYSGRVEAHVLVCVLAYALWKTLDHLAKQARLQRVLHKADAGYGRAQPRPRPMTPAVLLRELGQIQIGDIHRETTDGQTLVLRRVARPNAEQARILAALGLELPERLSPDRLL